ncbi:GAF domain-containing sensor histidine kinase [Tropicibacter sp. S64]|uniref:GAF domain-containing sensor histidine kinase n=1 Tax=Tropicibacter sp. S64 TaxID=3415122 RepID=UPI003C7BBEF3
MADTRPDERTDALMLSIAGHLAEVTDISAALDAVAEDIARIVPFTHCDICLLDRPGWVVSHEVGIRTRWSRASTRIDFSPIRDLLLGRCDVMLSDDATQDPRYTFPGATSEPIVNHRLRSRVNVLLRVKGRTIGTLNLSHSGLGLYDGRTVALARQIAAILAPWFHILHRADRARRAPHGAAASDEGLRRGALELTRAMDQERQRIGMGLHDQTLADLSRLLREVTAETPLPREAIAGRLSETIDDLRRIIDTAVPTLLDLFGFAHAVRVHLERAAGEDGPRLSVVDLTEGGPDRLDPTVRTALFHIAQEAINNATRHAGAQSIDVTVDQPSPTTLTVTIRDDGCGIPASPARQSGLLHMRTRARLISARLDVLAEQGTVVRVTLRAVA